MDTFEHIGLGRLLRFVGWNTLKGNPHVHIDEQSGILSLDLQGINTDSIPEALKLRLDAGTIIGMSGDYFGGKEVSFKLPSLAEFKADRATYDNAISLGHYLAYALISEEEEDKLIRSYQKLANPQVSPKDIDTINTINNTNYIPFSATLTEYVQQLMFALRVKNYSEMLTRNLSHFTPWSVRAYTIGHHLALKYARLHFEFSQYVKDPYYQSDNLDFNQLCATLRPLPNGLDTDTLQDLAHRFQALALGIEFFSFHYYTDHFAAGHGSFMGDLRAVLPKKFGTWGSILVNGLHDEANRVTIFTKRPYDPNPDNNAPPIEAGGDGDFDRPNNAHNKQACIDGMHASLSDLHQVFNGDPIPQQSAFSGVRHLLDVDPNYRQPQPLFILGENNKVYYRTELSKIRILSPTRLAATFEAPLENGYTELTSTWAAFILVCKLRLLPFIYQGTLQKPSEDELCAIEQDELMRNPKRQPIPRPPRDLAQKPASLPVQQWQKQTASRSDIMDGLRKNSLLAQKQDTKTTLNTEPAANLSM